MLFAKREVKPLNERPLPAQGFPESVIPEKNLKQTKDGPKAKVPAFTITAKTPMFWSGCCINAGLNFVDIARFEKLPRKTRLAVKQQIIEGNFEMQGYSEAYAELKKLQEAEKKAAKEAEKNPAKEDPEAQKAREVREASAAQMTIEDDEATPKTRGRGKAKPSDDPSLLD